MPVNTGKSQPQSRESQSSHQADWVDRLARLETHFGRFLWDILGVLLLSFALMTLVGILGLSNGTLLELWITVINTWLGWGSILVILVACALSILAFRRSRHPMKVHWGQVIGVEFALFLSLAILSILNGNRLTQGTLWGGQIGWGLSMLVVRFIGPIWGGVIIFLCWGLALLTAFRVWHPLELWLVKQSGEPLMQDPGIAAPEVPVVSALPLNKPAEGIVTDARKTAKKLPPEFRKSFKIPEQQDKTSLSLPHRGDRLPPLNVLLGEQIARPDERTINQTAGQIEKSLSEFGIPAKVVGFRIGPTVTQFAVQPGFIKKGTEEDAQQMKVRVAQIASLQKDLALSLSAERLRIEAPVPGRAYVGIEVPNPRSSVVRLRPLLETEAFYKAGSPLTIALGRDVSGNPLVADLSRMPHLLIAGTTGSGKSVCIAALAVCLAMNNAPEDLRMVMIDSKMVELIRFNGLPHLFGKVETDVQRILGVLRWV
ncbi:MAG: DNA translocase FtsK, partial [Anaerolineales bacterium]